MGECTDFYVTETIKVVVPFDPPHSLILTGAVRWVWEPFIDVTVGDTVVRFPREAFDCQDLELGQPASVELRAFEAHFGPGEYHPEEEVDYDRIAVCRDHGLVCFPDGSLWICPEDGCHAPSIFYRTDVVTDEMVERAARRLYETDDERIRLEGVEWDNETDGYLWLFRERAREVLRAALEAPDER